MKKLLACVLLLPAWLAAATLSPIQLLNPAGSTAGQAIVSTGASTAPAWANVTASGVTPIGANTVYGNFTGASASPIGNAVPSCSTANSALKYTTSTGLSCGTTFALTGANTFTGSQTVSATNANLTLNDTSGSGVANLILQSNTTTFWQVQKTASNNFSIQRYTGGVFQDNAMSIASATGIATFVQRPVFGSATPWDSANLNFATPPAIGGTTPAAGAFTTLSATGAITPSQTAGIVGTNTNNNANAGSVGEYAEATAGSTAITSATATNVTSISLTAGDWDVTGVLHVTAGTGDTITAVIGGVNTTSATLNTPRVTQIFGSVTAGNSVAASPMVTRVSIASTTTVYLVGYVVHSGGTANTQGVIRARRVR